MRILAAIAYTGTTAVLLHPLRSFVTTACLLAVLIPYVVGVGISKGVEHDADLSLQFGADLYVSATEFGRATPLPQAMVEQIEAIDGVRDVTPRIVGAIAMGRNREEAVLVGIPSGKLPPSVNCVSGRLFQRSSLHELVIGSELARALNLKVGDLLPPFYRNDKGERVSRIVGIFKSDVSLWQARLIFTSLESAQTIFDEPDNITAVLVNCRPGYADSVRDKIRSNVASTTDSVRRLQTRVISRDELAAMVPRGLLNREGIFDLHFILMIISAVLITLVTSGLGLPERRREIGILKAMGWQTDEVLFRSLVEGLLLSIISASIAILCAYVWLRAFNGFGIAGLFLSGVELFPRFPIPYQLTPIAALLALILSIVVINTGTLYATWRSATVSPSEALR